VELQIALLQNRLEEQGWSIEVTEAALDAIADAGYEPQYGARPLKRVIQQRLTNPLATELLKLGKPTEEQKMKIDFAGSEFVFQS
jgi:ATP-dependent Clp protease ATP-binding subunit ClpB